jgi:small-conductance mechanosensitive channel
MDHDWVRPTILLGGTLVAALLVGWLTALVGRRVGRVSRIRMFQQLYARCHRPWVFALPSVGLLLALPATRLPDRVAGPLGHAFSIAAIASVAWLLVKLLFVAEDAAMNRVRIDVRDNRRARRVRTQLATLRRLTAVVVAVMATAAILMTFSSLRAYGASVFASAGLAGIVAGLAAQTTLANVFAGLELVFTEALRIDDVVVVENEWGRIEELTLTYVVVHLWDERRLVLPATYFTTTTFQNWTRQEARVLGAVELYLDPATPIADLRKKAHEVVDQNPLWDRRDWVLQVTDMTERCIVVRVLASAADAPSAWDLRCDIREELLSWLVDNHPEALPRVRSEQAVAPLVGADATEATATASQD